MNNYNLFFSHSSSFHMDKRQQDYELYKTEQTKLYLESTYPKSFVVMNQKKQIHSIPYNIQYLSIDFFKFS